MKTSRSIKRDVLCALSVLCLALATTVSVFATEPSEAVKNLYLSAANKPTNIAVPPKPKEVGPGSTEGAKSNPS